MLGGMNDLTRNAASVAAAYALGCIQTGYYLVRARTGRDLRREGSGSTGARNVGRLLGRTGFVLTLAGDLLKGAVALGLAAWLGASLWGAAVALVAVAAGHVWPVQLGFSGGRGVAVGLGALLVYDPRLLLALGAVTLVAWLATRRFQVAGLAGFAALPVAAASLRAGAPGLVGAAGLCIIVLFAHRGQLAQLWRSGPRKQESGEEGHVAGDDGSRGGGTDRAA